MLTPVGDEFTINATTAGFQHTPYGVGLAGGGGVVVFNSPDSDQTGVFARLIDGDGAPMGGDIQISQTSVGFQVSPEVAALAGGGFVASWIQSDGDGNGIFARIFGADGAPVTDEFQVNAIAAGAQTELSVIGHDNGGFSIGWKNQSATPTTPAGVFLKSYNAVGAVAATDFVQTPSDASSDASGNGVESLTTLGDGKFVQVWQHLTPTSVTIQGRVMDQSGVPDGASFQIASMSRAGVGTFNATPFVTPLASDDFLVSWRQQSFDGASGTFTAAINARVFDRAGAPVTDEIEVIGGAGLTVSNFTDAALEDGGFVTFFSSNDGGGASLRGQRYDPSGAPEGGTFSLGDVRLGPFPRFDLPIVDLGDDQIGLFNLSGDGDGVGVFGDVVDLNAPSPGSRIEINTSVAGDQGNPGVFPLSGDSFFALWDSEGDIQGRLLTTGDPRFTGGDDIVTLDPAGETVNGLDGNDQITGRAGDDVILGGDGFDILNGGGGDDRLEGEGDADRLTGAAGDDQIDGGDGADIISGGGGNDVVNGGLGPDSIDLGPGMDMLTGAAAELDGDVVANFGLDDELFVFGARFDRADVTRTDTDAIVVGAPLTPNTLLDIDTDDDGVIEAGVTFTGDYAGGDFLAIASGPSEPAGTFITFEEFLIPLDEFEQVPISEVNGVISDRFLTGDGAKQFSLTFRSEGAANKSALGVYEVAPNGAIENARIVFENVNSTQTSADPALAAILDGQGPLSPGDAADLGVPAEGQRLGFFLVQDSFRKGVDFSGGVGFQAPGGGVANIAGEAELLIGGASAPADLLVFHSAAPGLNPGDAEHVLSGVAPGGEELLIGFEDLAFDAPNNDMDFNDVVFGLSVSDPMPMPTS